MNNNIKDTTSLVFVRGKNLIDPAKLMNGTAAKGTGDYSFVGYVVVTDYIKVEPGTYTVKLFNPGLYRIFRIVGYDENKNYMWDDSDFTVTERQTTITTTKYLRICFEYGNFDGLSPQGLMTAQPQLEQGQATTYEPYINKQIQIKNKNGVFEEFYNEGKNVIEKINNSNGTALLFDDGTMICYGNVYSTNISWSTWGSLYSASMSYTFPLEFVALPAVFCSVAGGANTGNGWTGRPVHTTTGGTVEIYRPTSYGNTMSIDFMAIGRWK